MASTDGFPTVVGLPTGMTAYLVEIEDKQGGTETQPIAAPDIVQAVTAAQAWAKSRDSDVRWIAEFGWTENLV
jgi:hypothetical protein